VMIAVFLHDINNLSFYRLEPTDVPHRLLSSRLYPARRCAKSSREEPTNPSTNAAISSEEKFERDKKSGRNRIAVAQRSNRTLLPQIERSSSIRKTAQIKRATAGDLLLTKPGSPVLIFTPIVSGLPVTRRSPRASCRAARICSYTGRATRSHDHSISCSLAVASAGPARTAGTSRKGVVISMEADRLNYPARKQFSPEVSFALNERAMRRGRFPCS
jgi:hypothetical protein